MKQDKKIAIIGGGIAGSTIASYFDKIGIKATLFEKKETLVSGPPICHLHAGGNLYREIDDKACITLLKESINLVKLYPNCIDYRPTILATPLLDPTDPSDLINRLKLLQNVYAKMVDNDNTNCVLNNPNNYFKTYSKIDLLKLKTQEPKSTPKSFDDWIIPFAKYSDLDKLKYPVIAVQEYGLNIFRLSATVTKTISCSTNIDLKNNTEIENITKLDEKFIVEYNNKKEQFDYIINSAGFLTGSIDDMVGIKRESLVEFKAAYITKWKDDIKWPEIIFFGQRGTPNGMGQFTPYLNGYFQLHGMTEDITLFKNGLVKNPINSSQPQLNRDFIDKIDKGWDINEVENRTKKAIKHITQYIPSFSDAKPYQKPLYGAQQIPGLNKDLRTADVRFDIKGYARCEIVKASSVIGMSKQIIQNLIDEKFIDPNCIMDIDSISFNIDPIKMAKSIANKLNYPEDMCKLVVYNN